MPNLMKNRQRPKRRGVPRKLLLVKSPGLSRVFRPLATSKTYVCSDTITIMSNAGTTPILFNGSTSYYNFHPILTTLADYSFLSQNYLHACLTKVEFELVRSVDEATMASNTGGCSVYLNYYPTVTSAVYSYADVSRNQQSYCVDLLTFDKQKVSCPVVSIDYILPFAGGYITCNNSRLSDLNLFAVLGGQLSIVDNNVINAASTRKLFTINVRFHVKLACLK